MRLGELRGQLGTRLMPNEGELTQKNCHASSRPQEVGAAAMDFLDVCQLRDLGRSMA